MSITLQDLVLIITSLVSAGSAIGAIWLAFKKLPQEQRVLQADVAQDQAQVIESSAKSAQQWLEVFAVYRADRIKSDEENITLHRRLSDAEDDIKRLRFQLEQKSTGEQALVEENKRLNAGVADLRSKLSQQEVTYEREKISHMNEIGALHLQLKDLTAKFEALTPKGEPT